MFVETNRSSSSLCSMRCCANRAILANKEKKMVGIVVVVFFIGKTFRVNVLMNLWVFLYKKN